MNMNWSIHFYEAHVPCNGSLHGRRNERHYVTVYQ